MRKNLLFVIIYFITLGMANAQESIVMGVVSDSQTGEGLPGVSILQKGSNNGTSSDASGKFVLSCPLETTLVVSFIGYARVEEQLNGRTQINFALSPQSSVLSEVVVTALGLQRDAKDLGYVVQKIEGAEVAAVKSTNFTDNLAGRLAGVTVSQGATGVGSTSKITIRGEASFTNNNPLFVIDGIPVNNNSILNFTNDAAAGFQEVDFGNGAMEVNPDDIGSVSVLKGPSAAALYGTRASNGVILITTKEGKTNKGLGLSFNTSTYFDRPFQLPKFQNQFGQGNSGQFEFSNGLGGGINDNISYSWGPALDQGLLIKQFDSPVVLPDGSVVRGGDTNVRGGAPITPSPFVSYPNNLKDFYQTGHTTINNLAISSGNDLGNFRLSFTDLRSESIIPGVNLDRKTIATHLNFTPTSKLKISSSINYANSQSDNRPANGYGSENVNYALVAWGPRSLDIGRLKDYWQPGLEGVQQYSFNYTFFDNPYFTLLENRNSFNRDRLFGNIKATYEITDHLNVSLRSGMDYSSENRGFRRAFSSNRFKNGAYAEHTVFYRETNSDFLINYHNKVGLLSYDLSVGGNRMDQQAATTQTQALSLAQPGIYKLSNAASPLQIFQFQTTKRINSFYALAKFGFKNFLYLDITGRNDWSSALATPTSTSNVSLFYPSVSASFLLSNVVTMPATFSFVKLRASLAQVGNDTSPYQTTGAFVSRIPYNSEPTFSSQNTIANASLNPEKTSSYELGTDVRLFDDRLRFDATYYNALTENQIISLPVAISSGFTEKVVNGGAVRSKGIEVITGISTLRTTNFQWNTTINFSRNVSTVESLPSGVGRLTLAYARVYDNVNQTVWFQVEEGGRIGDIYGTGYRKNENGEFILSSAGNYQANNDLIKLGNYNPDFMLGFSNQFNYKNWNLGFLFDWRYGGVLVSRTLALAAVGGQLEETANRPATGIIADGVVNVGSAENPVYQKNTTAITAESYYRQYYDRNHEENNTYSASYLKLREFSLGYTFKTGSTAVGILSKIKNFNVAVIGRNLFALSDIPHFDPEQLAVQGPKFVSGVEDMSYATSRSIGFKLGFDF